MRLLRFLGMSLMVLSLAGCSSKAELTNAEKIIGTWAVSKPAKGTPPDSVLVFTSQGKLTWIGTMNDRRGEVAGQYKVEGDKIVATRDVAGAEDRRVIKIKTLTDTTLVLEMPEGHTDEYRKK